MQNLPFNFYAQIPHLDAGGGVHHLKPDGQPGQEGGQLFIIYNFVHVIIFNVRYHHCGDVIIFHVEINTYFATLLFHQQMTFKPL